jgi:hypothetical protein
MHDRHAAIKREEPRDIRAVEKLPGQAGQVTQAPIAWIKMNTDAESAIRGEDAPAALEENRKAVPRSSLETIPLGPDAVSGP